MELIPLKNSLLTDSRYNLIKKQIIERVNELFIGEIGKYKNDNEFLVLVCNLIEHLVTKKDKINKQDLCVDICTRLFCLSEDDAALLRKNIDFVCAQKNLVKKVSFYKLFKTGLREIFFGK